LILAISNVPSLLSVAFNLPAASELGLLSLNTSGWSMATNGGANLKAQLITNEGSKDPNASFWVNTEEKFKQVNITSVIASAALSSPITGEIGGSGAKSTINDKFTKSYAFGDMTPLVQVCNFILGDCGFVAYRIFEL
jgi:hypothetical protein